MTPLVKAGIDLIEKKWPKKLNYADIGLLAHPASINKCFTHSLDIVAASKKFSIKALFGPQHGIRGETQDNMIEWEGFIDSKLGLPVYSLYSRTRKPLPKMIKDIDVMVIDLQDIGARYYTFIWTMALVMEACHEMSKAVLILDRPNPISGNITEGPVLDKSYSSFVGVHPLPIRHGMTIAEIGLYLKNSFYHDLELYIIPMTGWKRNMWFDDSGLSWVMPSPNMPTLETATVYPGMCLLEGTNISEGRGTTRPFEIFGAPFISPDNLLIKLNKYNLKGCFFRPMHFLPTFQKHSGKLCGGAQIHVTDRKSFKPFKTAVAILKSAYELYPETFKWNNPPYEYEDLLLPIDIIAGTDRVRKDIESGMQLSKMEVWWNEDLNRFNNKIRKNHLLY